MIFPTKPKSKATDQCLLILDGNGNKMSVVNTLCEDLYLLISRSEILCLECKRIPFVLNNRSFSCLAGPLSSAVSIPLDPPKPLMDQGPQNNLNPNYQTAQFVSDYCNPLRPHAPQSESNLPINIQPLTLQSHPQGMSRCTTENS